MLTYCNDIIVRVDFFSILMNSHDRSTGCDRQPLSKVNPAFLKALTLDSCCMYHVTVVYLPFRELNTSIEAHDRANFVGTNVGPFQGTCGTL